METKEKDPSMIVKFWGVRGSIPSPLTTEQIRAKEEALIKKILQDGVIDSFRENPGKIEAYLCNLPQSLGGTYGGNTTCIEVKVKNSPLIAIDAGTGARALGNYLIKRLFSGQHLNPLCSDQKTMRELHMFFSHYHWDHLQGFPFFGPAFIGIKDKTLDIHFYGKQNATQTLSKVLSGQQQYPNFPVVWRDMPCKKKYHELGRMNGEIINIGESEIIYQELDHPDSVFGYRVTVEGKSFVCATDTEHRDRPDPNLVSLAKGADVMFYDGQYTSEEYEGKAGPNKFKWGHSTPEWGVRNALKANVGILVIGHHEPMRDDFGIEKMYEETLKFRDKQLELPENSGKNLEIIMAKEEMELPL